MIDTWYLHLLYLLQQLDRKTDEITIVDSVHENHKGNENFCRIILPNVTVR
ncbi:hypothetical protein NSMM_400148 [Nitrosomonas mobilis]|uniref:Uncharacterized protein n=2 Tax=Nitrosomonas mobilis TaxID=51642 RepID=A0A1G5SFN5_9PROT|nr:hypothetical protein NSMM_400148 [Nitrosomonas mobilis]